MKTSTTTITIEYIQIEIINLIKTLKNKKATKFQILIKKIKVFIILVPMKKDQLILKILIILIRI